MTRLIACALALFPAAAARAGELDNETAPPKSAPAVPAAGATAPHGSELDAESPGQQHYYRGGWGGYYGGWGYRPYWGGWGWGGYRPYVGYWGGYYGYRPYVGFYSPFAYRPFYASYYSWYGFGGYPYVSYRFWY